MSASNTNLVSTENPEDSSSSTGNEENEEKYHKAMPIISFKQMEDKRLYCLNLIGSGWMPILQNSIATS